MGLDAGRPLKRSFFQKLTAPGLLQRIAARVSYALTSPGFLRFVAPPVLWLAERRGAARRAPGAIGRREPRGDLAPMKIAFDYQIFAAQAVGGISRYYARLASELLALGQEPRIVAPLHRGQFLGSLESDLVVGGRQERLPFDIGILNQTINLAATRIILGGFKPDVIHETYYSALGTASTRIPTVTTVHDMIHELYPSDFPDAARWTMVKRASVKRADHVICVSQQTRRDLIELFDCPPEKVSVVYHGADVPPAGHARPHVSAADSPFLLYVGVRPGYKNFRGLLAAVASSSALKRDFRIVAFGGGPLAAKETEAIEQFGLTGSVLQLGGDDAVLEELYRRAAALVYPSKYEGFGLPPLEAMARGCPVVSTNTSALPEVVGDAAEPFDPADEGAMARAIEAVVYSESHRAMLIERGKARARLFSWRRCAEETLAVYRTVTH